MGRFRQWCDELDRTGSKVVRGHRWTERTCLTRSNESDVGRCAHHRHACDLAGTHDARCDLAKKAFAYVLLTPDEIDVLEIRFATMVTARSLVVRFPWRGVVAALCATDFARLWRNTTVAGDTLGQTVGGCVRRPLFPRLQHRSRHGRERGVARGADTGRRQRWLSGSEHDEQHWGEG